MKFEIKRSEQGVEIHLFNEDGSLTVWLCDSEQAAVFKLTSLIFSRAENQDQAKRSILVGDFDLADAPKREKPLSERAAEVGKRLIGLGATEKGKTGPKPSQTQEEQADLVKELIDQLKKGTIQPYVNPLGAPNVYPGVYPGVAPSFPFKDNTYVGDLPSFPGSSIIVDVCGGTSWSSIVGSSVNMASAVGQITDAEVGTFLTPNNCQVNVFKTSMKAAG